MSEVKERLNQTLIDDDDEWQTPFREFKAETAKSRKVTSLMQTHDNKSKEEKLSAEAELVQYHLRIDGIPETTKDGPNNPVIKQESDNVKAVLEILEEPPEIENI